MAPIQGNYGAQAFAVVAAAVIEENGVLTIPDESPVQTAIVLGDLPAADPHRQGQLWNNAGAITISNG